MYSKDIWENGHQLIENMPKINGSKWWSCLTLSEYICNESPESPCIEYDSDPKLSKHCVKLDGRFSLAELEAIVIALVNERGQMRG